MKQTIIFSLVGVIAAYLITAQAQTDHGHGAHMPSHHELSDTRALVHFPPALRTHTLRNMRDHLAALGEIQQALSREDFERAAEVAERRLGMSSLESHGAHETGRHMPEEMAAIGTKMHHAASRFAVTANDAAATGDLRPVLARLAEVTAQCVACHGAFRLQ